MDKTGTPPPGAPALDNNVYLFTSLDPATGESWFKLSIFIWPIIAVAILTLKRKAGYRSVFEFSNLFSSCIRS
jgi:hypothetical protein